MSYQKSNIFRCIKVLFIILIVLAKCNFLFAQHDLTDSTEIYEYWSRRGIIEVIYAYMNDYITTVTDSSLPKEKIKDCTKEKKALNDYKDKFIKPLNKNKFDELPTLEDVSNFLKKNNWSGAEKNILQPLKSNLSSKKTLDTVFFSTLKPTGKEKSTVIPGYHNNMTNWNKTVSSIIRGFNEALRKTKPKKKEENTASISSNEIKQPIKGDEAQKQSVSNKQNRKFVLLIGFLSFFIGMFITYFIINLIIYYFFDDGTETYKNKAQHALFSFLYIIRLLKERKDYYKKEYKKLENEFKNCKNTIEELKNKIKELEKEIKSNNNDLKNFPDDSVEPIIKEADNISILFFSIPENDGKFIIKKGEQTNDGFKYYKIVSQISSDEGDLFYISGTQDKRAINRLDSYLKPVCDIENITNAESASKIEMIKKGKVIKSDDSWVIDPKNKVKIKLV